MQGGEEPLEDEESPLFGIGLPARSDEDGRVLSPVGRVLGERGGGQDERRGSQGGEITVEGGDRLRNRSVPGLELVLHAIVIIIP